MAGEVHKPAAQEVDDDDLQILLPQELRKSWVVIPRYQIGQFCVVCMVLGAAIAWAIAGWIYEIPWMYWSIPVGFTLLHVLNFALKGKERTTTGQARKYNSASKPDPAA